MLLRHPNARHSHDIDLYHRQAADAEAAAVELRSAAEHDLGDMVTFVFGKCAALPEAAHGTRLLFSARIGGQESARVKVDLVVGLAPVAEPVLYQLEPPFPMPQGFPEPDPVVACYHPIDHLADKVCALFERHGPEHNLSTRVRDLVDIILIARRSSLDGELLRSALDSEVARRNGRAGITLTLPPEFAVPNPAWRTSYPTSAKDARDIAPYDSWEHSPAFVETLLNPVLAHDARPGTWSPTSLSWAMR
ncbi:hypothetical protein GCM10022247_35810 [Allokutzneria multivorans]|uniref:Nucleotidyltransferase AbiEii toxin of type IV toxin-antitoxin system n=2 Tax=Allokutzneria multivorans TaxID=1142134 RepID=A0ABP7SDW4_9PSEU